MTVISGGKIAAYQEGCKVALARPTILIAATGEAESVQNGSRWNSLEKAQDALKSLPENPTLKQLNEWSAQWAKTLWTHDRQANVTPDHPGNVSELLLITKIDGSTYIFSPNVTWNGWRFENDTRTLQVGPEARTIYSGLCRGFVSTHDQYGVHRENSLLHRLSFRRWKPSVKIEFKFKQSTN